MSFVRESVPDWTTYADREGLTLIGRGKWRNLLCEFHEDRSPSLRVNTETGGWCCMACGVKGGDTLAHYMERSGLSFIAAARALGAWQDDGMPRSDADRPRTLSARDALAVVAFELRVLYIVISDARQGKLPSEADWQRFMQGVGRIEHIDGEFA